MNKKKQVKKAYRELLENHGQPLVKKLIAQDEEKSDNASYDIVDVVGKIIGKLVLKKIQDFLDGDRGFSFGGVKWGTDGQTGKGSISVYINGGWVQIVTFQVGDKASVVLGAGLSAINALVSTGTISREEGRRLKMFLFIAIIEMINEGVLFDDLAAETDINKINEFIESVILDENFSKPDID